jgi:hypothetical protein
MGRNYNGPGNSARLKSVARSANGALAGEPIEGGWPITREGTRRQFAEILLFAFSRTVRPGWTHRSGNEPLFISPLQAQKQKDVTVTELLSTAVTSSGQPIVLPQKDAQIIVSTYGVGPGASPASAGTRRAPAR